MPNGPLDTQILDKAISFAVKAHAGTERRGKGYPYIIHPLEALTIVSTITNDQELLAAAVLHDVVEDTDCTIEQLRQEFGDRVATIVESETDPKEDNSNPKASWRGRKIAGLERLTYATLDAKIVAMGDKLSNMRTIAQDYMVIGDNLWSRFHAPNGIKDYAWRYRALAGALAELQGTPAYEEFVQLIEDVYGPDTEHEPIRVNMDDYKQTGDGFCAISYTHKDGKRMMKLYSDFTPQEVIKKELSVSRTLIKMGVKTPKPLRFVTDGTRIGNEFECIPNKVSFARAISNDGTTIEKYGKELAKEIKQLHAKPCPKNIFPSATDLYRGYVAESPHFNADEKARLNNFIDQVVECNSCLHGDMHIGNIITNGQENWWIDVADFCWGNPLYDLGMFYLAAKCNTEELTMHLYHITNEQISQCWDAFVCEYFGIESPEQIEEANRMIAPFAALKMIYLGTRDKMYPHMLEFIRQQLLK